MLITLSTRLLRYIAVIRKGGGDVSYFCISLRYLFPEHFRVIFIRGTKTAWHNDKTLRILHELILLREKNN